MIPLQDIPSSELRAELLCRNQRKAPNPDAELTLALVAAAGRSYGLSPAQVLARNRDTGHCRARWAISVSLAHAGWVPGRIGAVLGLHRAAVANDLRRSAKLVAADAVFRGTVFLLRDLLAATSPSLPTDNI